MTDQELTEKAAKAAGVSKQWDGSLVDRENPSRVWDPLEDDGDAFRLACHLGIDLMHFHAQVAAKSYLPSSIMATPAEESLTDNRVRCAAMRRAIVRAAAGCAV